MSDWPKYESHKIVQAAVIVARHDDGPEGKQGRHFLWVDPGSGDLEVFIPTEPAMLERAELGGYAVVYDDGYKSVSPKHAFEGGYTKIEG